MHRLFVALDFPDEIKNELSLLTYGVPGARWTSLDQYHLTLRFIGEVDIHTFREVQEVLEEISIPSFYLRLKGVDFFKVGKEPKVLWAGMERSETLYQLRNKIENLMIRLGLPPDKRKFSPHVSLARLRDTPFYQVGKFLEGAGLFKTKPILVDTFHLFSSRRTPNGAIYKIEQSYSLAPLPAGAEDMEMDADWDFGIKRKY